MAIKMNKAGAMEVTLNFNSNSSNKKYLRVLNKYIHTQMVVGVSAAKGSSTSFQTGGPTKV